MGEDSPEKQNIKLKWANMKQIHYVYELRPGTYMYRDLVLCFVEACMVTRLVNEIPYP